MPPPVEGSEAGERVVTGGATGTKITLNVPTLPDPKASLDVFDETFRKRVIAAMMQPESLAQLEAGLQEKDPRERRLWWQLGLQHALPLLQGGKDGGGPSVRIVMNQQVPGPDRPEDGPLPGRRSGATIDVSSD